jgi:hypothetical protein
VEIRLIKRVPYAKMKVIEPLEICKVTRDQMEKIVEKESIAMKEWFDMPRPMIIITQFVGKQKKARKEREKAKNKSLTEKEKKNYFVNVDHY